MSDSAKPWKLGGLWHRARHFLDVFAREYGHPHGSLSPDADAALLAYPWPGNVRELAHLMERAVLLHGGSVVTADDLGLAPHRTAPQVSVDAASGVQVDFAAGGIVLDDVERELILKALTAAAWNRGIASQRLGLSKETLRYRIEKYRLQSPRPSVA